MRLMIRSKMRSGQGLVRVCHKTWPAAAALHHMHAVGILPSHRRHEAQHTLFFVSAPFLACIPSAPVAYCSIASHARKGTMRRNACRATTVKPPL
ncbi:hypothetical protein CC79DRAFT_775193 [Sarocladium strictum]